MRRVLLAFSVVVALAIATVDAAQLRLRLVGVVGGGEVGEDVLTISDLTYEGSYWVPTSVGGGSVNPIYAFGLALRYEDSDGTNPVHLISGSLDADASPSVNGHTFEWRDIEPVIPAMGDEEDPDNAEYPIATFVKAYGSVYGDLHSPYTDQRRMRYSGSDLGFFVESQGTDARAGYYWDATDERLYWTYAETYSGQAGLEEDSFYFGYSTLDYSTGVGTPYGPWTISGQKFKSGFGGLVGVPSAFVSATGLGSKRLAIGFGGYGSLVASGDVSLGPSLTAFTPPGGGATEQTALTGTPLIGFWPYASTSGAGRDRMTRPAGYEYINSPVLPYDSWTASDKLQWFDSPYTYGVWIHGASKSGFITASSITVGQATYYNATAAWEKQADILSIVSEADLADVVAGTQARYEIQPVSYVLQFGAVDYTTPAYTPVASGNISTITSDSGFNQHTYNATVTTTGAHGLSDGDAVAIRGTDHDSDYSYIWEIDVQDSTSFKLRNLSNSLYAWSGNAASGGTYRTVGGVQYPGYPGNSSILIKGLAFDENTCKLYMLYAHPNKPTSETDVLMVARWAVAAGCS